MVLNINARDIYFLTSTFSLKTDFFKISFIFWFAKHIMPVYSSFQYLHIYILHGEFYVRDLNVTQF